MTVAIIGQVFLAGSSPCFSQYRRWQSEAMRTLFEGAWMLIVIWLIPALETLPL